MKTKHFYNILINGILYSWTIGFLVSILQSLIVKDSSAVMWFLLIASIIILMLKNELNKSSDISKLVWVESFFLIANIVTILIAIGGFLVTFSKYWLAKDIAYTSLALGLPSLVALVYWYTLKRRAITEYKNN